MGWELAQNRKVLQEEKGKHALIFSYYVPGNVSWRPARQVLLPLFQKGKLRLPEGRENSVSNK